LIGERLSARQSWVRWALPLALTVTGGVALCGWLGAASRALPVLLLGWAGGATLAWLLREGDDETSAPLGVLLMAAGVMAGHFLLQGVGAALIALAAWWPLSLAVLWWSQEDSDEANLVAQSSSTRAQGAAALWTLGAVIVMYRVFEWRYRLNLRDVSSDDFYTFFMLLTGASLPLVMARAGLIAPLLAAALVAAMGLVWGARGMPGLFFGFAISAAFLAWSRAKNSLSWPGPLLLSSWCALLLCQWALLLLPVSQRPRAVRIQWLIALAITCAVLLVGRVVMEKWKQARSEVEP
jgi:hypothetical protein